ncbi:MAG: hypothetical protein CMF49_07930, partial [Legionellales bacterium]|nr:hypothetical protein [Legionellales bacterium]
MNNIQKLILAVQFGNLETVKNLIENEKIDINTSTKVTIKSNTYNGFLDNTTALHEACRQLDYEIVAYLLKNGADVNIIAAVSPTDRQDGLIGWTVLHSLIVGYIFKQEEENAPANALEVLRLIKIKEIKDTNFLKYTIPVETGDSKAPQNYSIQSLLESFELTKKPISLKYFMKIMIPSCIRHIKSLKEKTEALAVNAEVPEDKEKTEALAVNTEVPEDKEKTEALAVKAEVPEDEVKSNSTSSEKKLASPTFHPIVLDSLSNFIKMLQLLIQSYPKNQRPHTIRHFQSILDKKEYTKEE